MPRKTIIAGNWKMNLVPDDAEQLIMELKAELSIKANLEVVVIPQTGLLAMASDWILDSPIRLGSQNCSPYLSGAYTGETSPALLKTLGCHYGLVGHSERREYFGESDELVAQKTAALISMGKRSAPLARSRSISFPLLSRKK